MNPMKEYYDILYLAKKSALNVSHYNLASTKKKVKIYYMVKWFYGLFS